MNLTAAEKAVITAIIAVISAVVAFVPSFSAPAEIVIGFVPTLVAVGAFIVDEIEKGTDATLLATAPKPRSR